MTFKVTNIDKGKSSFESPVMFVPQMPKSGRIKKCLIIGLSSVIIIGLLVTCILVCMYIFTEANKDIVKFTLQLNKDRSQDVTSDVTGNIVQYHVKDGDHEAWIINDFNTDIKVTKIVTATDSNCYISPLNRSTAMEPAMISKPTDDTNPDPAEKDYVIYQISGDPIYDISFLNKQARNLCSDGPTYWIYPTCYKTPASPSPNKTRLIEDNSPYYTKYIVNIEGTNYNCFNGCCKTVCACEIKYTWFLDGNKIICNWIARTCCGDKCYYKSYCSSTRGLTCQSGCN